MAFTTGSTNLYQAVPGNLQNGRGGFWVYYSSDSAADVATTGYFKGVMRGGNGDCRGVFVSDLLCNIESTAGVTPHRVSWHAFVSSTANGTTSPLGSTVGFDGSVSLAATT